MYTVVYLFPVPKAKTDMFLRVQREAGAIYKQCGALSDETLEPRELEAAYGCAGFSNVLSLEEGENSISVLAVFVTAPTTTR